MNYFGKSYFLPFICEMHSVPSAAEPLTQAGNGSQGMRNIVQSQHQMSVHLDLAGKCRVL